MNRLGDARRARPPVRSRRARRRGRQGRVGTRRPIASQTSFAAARPMAPTPSPVGPAIAVDRVVGTGATVTAAPPESTHPEAPHTEAVGATMTLTEAPAPPPSPADEGVAADDTPPGAGTTRSHLRNTVEWVVIIGAALLAAVLIKTYLLQAFYIPSSSMEHTLEIQDRVLVNKLSYRLHDVNRGDVVVFERPPNDLGQIRDLIKRVIALSGETVEGRDGAVYVNGRRLREPYLGAGTMTAPFGPETIPAGYVWVMGDNRSNSSDSRVFGAIPESRIVGRAFVRVWPITALELL